MFVTAAAETTEKKATAVEVTGTTTTTVAPDTTAATALLLFKEALLSCDCCTRCHCLAWPFTTMYNTITTTTSDARIWDVHKERKNTEQ